VSPQGIAYAMLATMAAPIGGLVLFRRLKGAFADLL
jgi:hypothetical protein